MSSTFNEQGVLVDSQGELTSIHLHRIQPGMPSDSPKMLLFRKAFDEILVTEFPELLSTSPTVVGEKWETYEQWLKGDLPSRANAVPIIYVLEDVKTGQPIGIRIAAYFEEIDIGYGAIMALAEGYKNLGLGHAFATQTLADMQKEADARNQPYHGTIIEVEDPSSLREGSTERKEAEARVGKCEKWGAKTLFEKYESPYVQGSSNSHYNLMGYESKQGTLDACRVLAFIKAVAAYFAAPVQNQELVIRAMEESLHCEERERT